MLNVCTAPNAEGFLVGFCVSSPSATVLVVAKTEKHPQLTADDKVNEMAYSNCLDWLEKRRVLFTRAGFSLSPARGPKAE